MGPGGPTLRSGPARRLRFSSPCQLTSLEAIPLYDDNEA